MRGQELSLLKWSGLLLVLTALLLTGCSRSGEAGKADEAMLRMEHVEPFYRSIPQILDAAGGVARKDFGAGVDADLALLRPVMEAAFKVEPMLARARQDLKAVEIGNADLSAFLLATDAFMQAQAAIEAENKTSPDKVRQAAAEAYAQRADKNRIENLARNMAITDIQVEGALLGRRLQEAAAFRHVEEPAAWQRLDDQGLENDATKFVQRTRAEGDRAYSPFRDDLLRGVAQEMLMIVLLRLPEPSLKALEDFYSSDVGKAKRKALVAAVAAQSDADTKEMMIEYLRQLR
ncbi:hypothetical protein [Niveispirillum sp. BGYR6]|uniref:hypothetical protein n=1 Tax=Niveispirillum sp. BGYR6 TaxID=2971249 RepID=UPI0022B9B90B|nr:hypothetical protein [Niveispirillum sp. BGYR6]MDG5496782.1 hypothetical protein [Niveispirillum sp. BGYR6]